MAKPGSYPELQGVRVLVVEDETLVAMDLEARLEEAGCTVLGLASTCARALELLEQEHPDLVLLDLNLGGERPTAMAKAMRERHVPFVIVSGYSEQQVTEPAFEQAPRLNKPVSTRLLLRTLALEFGAS